MHLIRKISKKQSELKFISQNLLRFFTFDNIFFQRILVVGFIFLFFQNIILYESKSWNMETTKLKILIYLF